MWDRLLVDCNIATMDPEVPGPFGAIENGAIGIQDGKVVRVGKRILVHLEGEQPDDDLVEPRRPRVDDVRVAVGVGVTESLSLHFGKY